MQDPIVIVEPVKDLTLWLGLSGTVNRGVELFGRWLDQRDSPPDKNTRAFLLLGAQIILGLVIVIVTAVTGAEVNLLSDVEGLNNWGGVLITGVAVGLGAEVIHLIVDLTKAVRNWLLFKIG